MEVARIGFTPVKGGRHRSHGSVELTQSGAVGDRAFCLVARTVDRCLRTIDHPTLMQASASWQDGVLSVELPSGTAAGAPVPTGEVRTVDYWGRGAPVEVVDGPWAAAYSDHLGRDVVLGATRPGDVVYGASVTLVTAASLARLAEQVGAPVEGARFRATFQLDGDLAPRAEEDWVGRGVRIGTAELWVRDVVPRCAVIDHHPETGVRDLRLLEALARGRRVDGNPVFGVEAEVTAPGHVTAGDRAELVGP